MRRAFSFHAGALALVLAGVAGAASCATATGEISGGDPRFDASAPLSVFSGDAGPLSPGHSWQALYADYFGNPGRASCAGNGSCHGTASQPGSQSSNFVCPANDKDACYTSIVSGGANLVVAKDPSNSALITQVLRHADGSAGNMPKTPPYGFSADDLQRISDWINDGAQNDLEPVGVDSGPGDDADVGDAASD